MYKAVTDAIKMLGLECISHESSIKKIYKHKDCVVTIEKR